MIGLNPSLVFLFWSKIVADYSIKLWICGFWYQDFAWWRPTFSLPCQRKSRQKERQPCFSLFPLFHWICFTEIFWTRCAQTDENCLKIESRKGDLYEAPNLSEHYLKSVVNFEFILRTKNILSFDRTLNRRKNKLGSLLFHLCGIEFVGNFRLFERSEFRKFPLSKFNGTKKN